jgi:hypothetical protein
MSHFVVYVITETGSQGEVEEQLAPFHEYECTGIEDEFVKFVDMEDELRKRYEADPDKGPRSFDAWAEDMGYEAEPETGRFGRKTNPDAKWDWWVIGGRWDQNLLLKDGSKANVATIKAIDFETEVVEAAKDAAETYDKAQVILSGEKVPSWKTLKAEHPDNPDAAREAFWGSPAMKRIDAARGELKVGWTFDWEDLNLPRDRFIELHSVGASYPYSIVREREWLSRGEMGWFGMSSGDLPRDAWAKKCKEIFEAAGPEAYITVVDCHI